jgi:hypothetical protein
MSFLGWHFGWMAARITPGKSQIIDPTIHNWQKHFRKEKINFYYPQKPHSNIFYRKYQLIEKYCTDKLRGKQTALKQY